MATRNDVVKQIMLMAKMFQYSMPEDAAEMYLKMIGSFPPDVIMRALNECGRKIPRFPAAADVVSRCEAQDGRPGVEEAWAMIPKDEYGSVVWTEEMATAFGAAGSLMDSDVIAARMAFKESYEKQLTRARATGRPVTWSPSFGFEKRGRERAVLEAVERNRITMQKAIDFFPELQDSANLNPRVAAEIRKAIGHG